ncbi:uncharacterized protein Bfra_010448 [Botrytis fragariae]|uniref:Protein kinase domain-containing protein n=1 Tax=Botrytis fragariae TaxID=1964551 RepID=A0A8H6AGC9_9HELO|nr:uncharacterized protein Bfra_010448 [Botrytis fragariae]KAF5867474.1 hypothetical protein Bfra_010448 [Botrytis fragariae]
MDKDIESIYTEGAILELRSESRSDAEPNGDTTSCKIIRFFEPPTLSCVMEVELLNQPDNKRAVLKVFDRRFASQLRADYKIGPSTAAKETAFVEYVKSGDASKFVDRLRNDEDFEESKEGWTMGQNEAYLYDLCLEMYEAETTVYRKLEHLQGKEIPQLLAQVRLHATTAVDEVSDNATDFFQIKGILIELIDGYTLSELPTNAPRESWGDICHEAVRVVRLLDDYSILNEDVRPSNIMVTRQSTQDKYRIVMLDFAQCVFRDPEETDKQWGRKKWNQDEEGAIGLVMRHRLKKLDYDFPFEHSNHFLEWAVTEFPSEDEDEGHSTSK